MTAALSLTGSGHLLVYQLGACRTLLKSTVNIQHVAGSSGGAIVATLLAKGLDLDDYACDFIKTGGRGFSLLKDRLTNTNKETVPVLSICTTRCRDGQLQVFDFGPDDDASDGRDASLLLSPALEASCRIPPSFHPWDILSSSRSYAHTEGILIGDESYVDGGIAAPAPPTPATLRRILISPIAGASKNDWRISPSSIYTSNYWPSIRLDHDFGVDASMGNLRALRAASGMTTASELQEWYQRGQDDAIRFLEDAMHW